MVDHEVEGMEVNFRPSPPTGACCGCWTRSGRSPSSTTPTTPSPRGTRRRGGSGTSTRSSSTPCSVSETQSHMHVTSRSNWSLLLEWLLIIHKARLAFCSNEVSFPSELLRRSTVACSITDMDEMFRLEKRH